MIHDPEEMRLEWLDTVDRIYTDVVAGANPEVGISVQDAFDEAADRIQVLIDDGDLKPPTREVILTALRDVDRRHGKHADRLIEMTATGQAEFDLGDTPALRIVVTLGLGVRKVWRDCTEDDLVAMDENRYRNLHNAQASYDRWRESYEPVRRAVRRYVTIGGAVAAGAFDDAAEAGVVR
jgi:hypothetical protein